MRHRLTDLAGLPLGTVLEESVIQAVIKTLSIEQVG